MGVRNVLLTEKTIVAIEKRNVGDSAIFCRYDDNMIRA